MLGIVGANLLLNRRRPNWEQLKVVTRNLHRLVGNHPDVCALSLALERHSGTRIESIDAPPTLRRSWDHIVQASRRRANLVPSDGAVARISAELVNAGPWLMHRLTDAQVQATHSISLAQAARLVEKLVALDSERLSEVVARTREGEGTLSGLERGVLSAALAYRQGEKLVADAGENAQKARSKMETSARSKARNLLGDLPAPSYSIAEAVASLADKLEI